MTLSTHPIPLQELLLAANVAPKEILGRADIPIAGLSDFAQCVQRHFMFFAKRGVNMDSHFLISDAIERGAAAVLVDRETPWYPGATIVRVDDARKAAALIAHAFYQNPGRRLKIAGVTGTTGKTTTTHFIESILKTAGMRVGLIGTNYYRWNDNEFPADTTTPSSLRLAAMMAQMESDRVEAVVVEVSSHAIDQARIAGIPFKAGALCNVSHDHLDYHGDMPTYIETKRRFFMEYVAASPGSTSIFNFDDLVGEAMVFTYPGQSIAYTMHSEKQAAIKALEVSSLNNGLGLRFRLSIHGRSCEIRSSMNGVFNIYNMLAAAGAAASLGVDLGTIAEGIVRLKSVPGRFEKICLGQDFNVLVDFAHTPLAMERMLQSARQITDGRLVALFGCGGKRDRTKRALMGRVAGKCADAIILTNDNTRGEEPGAIAAQIMEGINQTNLVKERARVILDREEAIETALREAQTGDSVVIIGRGHERYLDLGATPIPFDDREIASAILSQLLAERGRKISPHPESRHVESWSSTSIAPAAMRQPACYSA